MTGAFSLFDFSQAAGGVVADFSTRVTGLQCTTDREQMVARLQPWHERMVAGLGFSWNQVRLAEQVHGADVAEVTSETTGAPVGGVDGLVTNDPQVCLGIYVADCAAIYVSDPVNRAIALLHSGRKGTELGILRVGVEKMSALYGSRAEDLVVQVSPCIRPPHYEFDIPAALRSQAAELGIRQENTFDCGICTATAVDRYYSYRVEKGKTGRMLALLAI